jgi:hypothetical protein
LPFSLIAISIIMAFIHLNYIIFSYFEGPYRESFILDGYSSHLILPLFALGMALLLMLFTNANKGWATWSRLIFIGGTALLVLSGLIFFIYYYEASVSEEWGSYLEFYRTLALFGDVANVLGIMLCFISTVFLVKAYFKGEIFPVKHS